jgi:hypothetical protein
VKEFVRFSTTDVFVPVSQLSTRDLFDFLENLKFRQDMFFLSWISRRVRRALWYPYSRLFFGIVFKKVLFLEFYKVNCGVNIGFWHISFRKMFKLLTCKGNHDFWDVMMRMSFIKKKTSWHDARIRAKWVSFIVTVSLMVRNDVCFKSSNCRWASCWTIKNRYHGLWVF